MEGRFNTSNGSNLYPWLVLWGSVERALVIFSPLPIHRKFCFVLTHWKVFSSMPSCLTSTAEPPLFYFVVWWTNCARYSTCLTWPLLGITFWSEYSFFSEWKERTVSKEFYWKLCKIGILVYLKRSWLGSINWILQLKKGNGFFSLCVN